MLSIFKNSLNQPIIPVKKFFRIALKSLLILFALLLVLYSIAYWYISTHKKEILADFTLKISEKINGKVTMANADISLFETFPRIAIHAHNVLVTDSMYTVHQHPFFKAQDLFVNINILKAIKKQPPLTGIRVVAGTVYLFTDTSGYSNTYLLKSKKDPAGGPKKTEQNISLKEVRLQNVHFVLKDDKREKLHDIDIADMRLKISDEGELIKVKTKAALKIHGLAFNLPKGTFLKNSDFSGDFVLNYGKTSQKLSFTDIPVVISKEHFMLTGSFDLGDKNPQFVLKIVDKAANFDTIKKLMPDRIAASLSKAHVDKPIDALAELQGPLSNGEPLIHASWKVKNTKLTSIFMDFDDASFEGFYSNEVVKGLPRKDPNSVLTIHNFSGKWHGLPATSKSIEILNLKTPILTCDLQSAFPLPRLNELLSSSSLQLLQGNASVSLQYKGPVEKTPNSFSYLNGFIKFANGTINYSPRNVDLKNVNGSLTFKNADVNIDNLQCTVLSNKIIMNGSAKQLLSLISSDVSRVKINYNIYSPSLNVSEFLFLLKSRNSSAVKSGKDASFGSVSNKLDAILEKSRIDMTLKADKILYKKFTASNVLADITILENNYQINDIKMQAANGTIKLKGSLMGLGSGKLNATLHTNVLGVDVSKLFYSFDNFGQDGISYKNLTGNLTADGNMNLKLKEDGTVIPNSATGYVNFSLKKGALINFQPVMKIQNFIFRKRDFSNIDFAELKNRLVLKNGDIEIPRMEIQSSVLTMFVEGTYSNHGNTDVSIQVPLNNLKKRDEDYVPENIGTDKKGGRSIFLRGQPGADGNVNFKLDLFKKYQKDHNIDL